MFKQTLIAATAAALLAGATIPAAAQQSPPPAPKRELRVYGEEVMTTQERQAYVDRMRAAKTREERIKLRDEHRAEMQLRAKEKGVTLQEPQRRGGEKGSAKGKGGPSPAEQLFTEQERADFRKRMQDAKTPAERDRIRGEMRTQAEARAKEKGVTLPEPRGAKPAPAPEAPKAQ